MDQNKAADFFENTINALKQVGSTTGFINHFYNIAGHVICFCFGGNALISTIARAFEHLRLFKPVKPELTIYIVDSESTQVTLNLPRWLVRNHRQARYKHYDLTANIYSIYNDYTQEINLINLQTDVAIFWAKSVDGLPWWISGIPLVRILHVWMKNKGKQLVHAGAVGTANGGVLLAGRSGSGKSTTTLACLEQGFNYVSEDYCLLDNVITPHVYSLYNSAKLTTKTLDMFPYLKYFIANTDRMYDDKALVFQQEIYPERLLSGFPVRAVLLPEITANAKSQLIPVSIIRGLFALAPSTFFQLQYCNQDSLIYFKTLLTKVPCYRLLLGSDLNGIVQAVKECFA